MLIFGVGSRRAEFSRDYWFLQSLVHLSLAAVQASLQASWSAAASLTHLSSHSFWAWSQAEPQAAPWAEFSTLDIAPPLQAAAKARQVKTVPSQICTSFMARRLAHRSNAVSTVEPRFAPHAG